MAPVKKPTKKRASKRVTVTKPIKPKKAKSNIKSDASEFSDLSTSSCSGTDLSSSDGVSVSNPTKRRSSNDVPVGSTPSAPSVESAFSGDGVPWEIRVYRYLDLLSNYVVYSKRAERRKRREERQANEHEERQKKVDESMETEKSEDEEVETYAEKRRVKRTKKDSLASQNRKLFKAAERRRVGKTSSYGQHKLPKSKVKKLSAVLKDITTLRKH